MDFDASIFEAVESGTLEKPHDLVQILAYVDSRDRLVLSHEELSGGLQRLIAQGRVAELPRHKFYKVTDDSAPRTFSGLTPEEHLQACEAYEKWFWKTYRKLSKK
jgi:hypothetical protein